MENAKNTVNKGSRPSFLGHLKISKRDTVSGIAGSCTLPYHSCTVWMLKVIPMKREIPC